MAMPRLAGGTSFTISRSIAICPDVISSSLGDAGANVACPTEGFPRYVPDRIDLARLMGLPRGDVVTYGELAALAGKPRAARAAGTFCANNRYAVFVPCHRVVGANGIGGYGSLGVDYKRRLLALERVAL